MPAERKTNKVNVWLTPAEFRAVRRAAHIAGCSFGDLLRAQAEAGLRQLLRDAAAAERRAEKLQAAGITG